MNLVEEYRTRIGQATSLDQKKALAAELHQLTDTFDDAQWADYKQAMTRLREDVAKQLIALEPYVGRAGAVLSRYVLIKEK